MSQKFYVKTPLIESTPLRKKMGCNVYLKLETAQINSCFKIRGISNHMNKAFENGYTSFVSSSGGNAGMAAAYTARKLGAPIKVVVPSTTPEFSRQRLRDEDAEVIVEGSSWDFAQKRALEEAKKPGVFAVHPFDHPDIWSGHASLVEELHEDMPVRPDLIVTSVGGGGLAMGLLEGMECVGWADVPLLCMETVGADCFNTAVKAGKVVTLPSITSFAICLGALTVVPALFEKSMERPILSEVVTDQQCFQALLAYLDDHKQLVEPACAAALSALYCGTVETLVKNGKLKEPKNIIVIVCGGMSVNLDYIAKWKQQFNME